MGFRKDEIRVEADATEDEAADFVTHECPECGHPDVFHPEMVGAEGVPVRCGECAHDLGSWEELSAKLFPGRAMLAAALTRRP